MGLTRQISFTRQCYRRFCKVASHQREKSPRVAPECGQAGEAGATCQTTNDRKSFDFVKALKAWRLAEARRQGVPAFRILTDRTLGALASARPANEAELLAVAGLGPRLVARYGTALLRFVVEESATIAAR